MNGQRVDADRRSERLAEVIALATAQTAPPERPVWVGDFWDMFGAGHELEIKNLKAIAEYRHRHGLPVTPDWMR